MVDLDTYLSRIGVSQPISLDLESLTLLQRAHMTSVPFENLDVFFGVGVGVDPFVAFDKIVRLHRGGWCFELNGAFALLLEGLGFSVGRLGAAVLLGGPATVIDHLCLEVQLDEPYLVDVGFGETFIRPLRLNEREPQDGGNGLYQFFESSQGLTLCLLVDGVPEPQYRFRRVFHEMSDFAEASDRLQNDKSLHWSQKPFATRLMDGGPDRVKLLGDRLKTTSGDNTTETPVPPEEWSATLKEWFNMEAPVQPRL